jgi:catechol 2,3-dioxygenase-like lactoylglutathione lyase family enzyme
MMDDFFGRSVFFVKDAEESLAFYTKTLGFTLDWNHQVEGRAFVFQVSLFGFQLILNQIEDWTKARAGHGRVFVGLDDNQIEVLRQHISAREIKTKVFHWGAPTLVITDLDGSELFFSLPRSEWASLELELAERRA